MRDAFLARMQELMVRRAGWRREASGSGKCSAHALVKVSRSPVRASSKSPATSVSLKRPQMASRASTDAPLKKLGIIGGLGVGATVHYYQGVVFKLADALGTSSPPEVILAHADFATVLQFVSRFDCLAAYMASLGARLERAGCEVVAIAAVTPYLCVRQLSPLLAMPLVTPFEALAVEIGKRKITRLSVLGSKFIMESRLAGLLPASVEVVQPSADDCQVIHRSFFTIIERTSADVHASLADIREVINAVGSRMCDGGAQCVLLADTEFSLLFSPKPLSTPTFPFIDLTDLHMGAIVSAVRHRASENVPALRPSSSRSQDMVRPV